MVAILDPLTENTRTVSFFYRLLYPVQCFHEAEPTHGLLLALIKSISGKCCRAAVGGSTSNLCREIISTCVHSNSP